MYAQMPETCPKCGGPWVWEEITEKERQLLRGYLPYASIGGNLRWKNYECRWPMLSPDGIPLMIPQRGGRPLHRYCKGALSVQTGPLERGFMAPGGVNNPPYSTKIKLFCALGEILATEDYVTIPGLVGLTTLSLGQLQGAMFKAHAAGDLSKELHRSIPYGIRVNVYRLTDRGLQVVDWARDLAAKGGIAIYE